MKALFGSIVVDGRNKLGGHVYSKNRSGSYVRTKVTPVNGQTAQQQLIRGRFGAASQAWRGLTEAQRQTWINAAPDFPVFDIFGNSKILSGSQLYNRLNLNLAAAGQAAITSAPSPVAITSLVSLTGAAAAGAGTFTITAGIAAVPAGNTAILLATPQYGAGRYFVKNRYRQLTTFAAAGDIDAVSIVAAYEAKFGDLVAGQKISVKRFLVVNATGQAGVPFSAVVTVAA